MNGRIKKNIMAELSDLSDRQSEVFISPLCNRSIAKLQQDEHHLIPKPCK